MYNDEDYYSRPYIPTIDECVRALDWPTEQWRGQCYGVALALVEAKLIDGRAVYGHYYGPISPTSNPFGARAGTSFPTHHGWIVTPDGQILDPTRWVFEDREPYIYHLDPCNCGDYDVSDNVGDEESYDTCYCDHTRDEHRAYGFFRPCNFSGNDYDEGCQRWLEDHLVAPPPDEELTLTKRTFDLPLTGDARRIVYSLLKLSRLRDDSTRPLSLSIAQAMWLAHLPVDSLGMAARAIYEAMEACGAGAFIPIDSQKLVFPDTY